MNKNIVEFKFEPDIDKLEANKKPEESSSKEDLKLKMIENLEEKSGTKKPHHHQLLSVRKKEDK